MEVRGKSVEVAVAAAMNELGIADRDGVDVEVIQEPEKGFLGMGGRDAIVRVKPRSAARNRRRRRGRGDGEARAQNAGPRAAGPRAPGSQVGGGNRSERKSPTQPRPPGRQISTREPRSDGGNGGHRDGRGRTGDTRPTSSRPRREREARVSTANPHEQAPMVQEFLDGLLAAFGLEGVVTVTVDDEVIVVEIDGEQTEALVGPRGSVMEAIHEITKTVLHRQADDTARVRIDIAGYAERRRQALSIYAGQLIEQIMGEGGEIMLEPMSAADRKVIHDAVAAHDGVRSYSEGEPPRRYVVIAAESAADQPGPPDEDQTL
ncbi:MAG: RNA-binding cell elongation regulator Jag/EloR [Acidimicrobiia bacterium]